jgi:hypothetical protein
MAVGGVTTRAGSASIIRSSLLFKMGMLPIAGPTGIGIIITIDRSSGVVNFRRYGSELDAERGRLSHRLTVRNQGVPKLGEFVPAGLHLDGVLSRRQSE